ncbi:MAG: HupE/UreJ family protein [Burkholderiales bacterium]|nr:HupE/UreJ family protein [Burkholderiales bacterium]
MRFEALRRWLWRGVFALGLSMTPWVAQAHKSSDAYLQFDSDGQHTQLRWDIALRDLDAILELDADGDRALTWGEVRQAWPRIDALALQSLSVPGCTWHVGDHALERRADGAYAVIHLHADCAVTSATTMDYRLMLGVDPTHRGIARIVQSGQPAVVRMLVPAPAAAVSAVRASAPAVEAASGSFIGEGVHHILTGYDHMLFLLCLLLPAVMRREGRRWQPVSGWRGALLPVAKTVTLFTLAHSVTLALAALEVVRLSPRFIEPAIAVTIMLAALDNIVPLAGNRRGLITFVFGLIHGFGFAGVLGELQLPTAAFGWALFQFNLGIEIGQLSLVAVVVPLLYALRHSPRYVRWVMGGGSCVAIALAAVWFIERITSVSLLPF